MAEDAELVSRAASGDQHAAGEIYVRYAPLVRAIVLDATGSLAEADELVQQVFLQALRSLGQLRQQDRLCGWLVGIARRAGVEYRRQAARRRARYGPLEVDPPQHGEDAAVENRADTIAEVRTAVGELPERERLAVHIHYLCGEPVEAARQALGLSPAGFYKLLDRARERLRAKLLHAEKKR
jgi:RNA polymerase sigma-70 factor (ECF subfamily)